MWPIFARAAGRGGSVRAMSTASEAAVLEATERLAKAIASRDKETYASLVSDDVTCFEPEAKGHLVSGRGFHEYYFTLPEPAVLANSSICDPRVNLVSDDVAVVSYVKLEQLGMSTRRTEETRVWRLQDEAWKLVHFHRSIPSQPRPVTTGGRGGRGVGGRGSGGRGRRASTPAPAPAPAEE